MTVKELFDAIPISCDPLIWVSEDDGCDALVTANPELLEFLNDQDLGIRSLGWSDTGRVIFTRS